MKEPETEKLTGKLTGKVKQVVEALHSSDTDPLGSYTGVDAENPYAQPTQDADDL